LASIPPGVRGDELFTWGNYLNEGGEIAPLHFMDLESADPKIEELKSTRLNPIR
jgi:hypothetical protein